MLKDIPFVKDTVTEIYGSDFADYRMDDKGNILPFAETKDKPKAIQSVARVVIPSDKIRIMHEISKGCKQGNFDACVGIKLNDRRIPFPHMIYVGDGVSDIYAFDTVKSGGGYTVGVYNPNDPQFEQIEMIREDGWLDILGVADYTPGATISTWILRKVEQMQYQIRKAEAAAQEAELEEVRRRAPRFIHSWTKKDKW
jgi:hypothetical protein